MGEIMSTQTVKIRDNILTTVANIKKHVRD